MGFRTYNLNTDDEEEIHNFFTSVNVIKWEINNINEEPTIIIEYSVDAYSSSPKPKGETINTLKKEREELNTQISDLNEEKEELEESLKKLNYIKEEAEKEPEPEPEEEAPQTFTKPVKPLCSFCNAELPWKRNKDDFDFHKNGVCIKGSVPNGEE